MTLKKRKICFIVNSAAFFMSHRSVIASELLRQGVEVHVITAPGEGVEAIYSLGAIHHAVSINRSGKNIFSELRTLWAFTKVLRRIEPDLVHLVTIKPMLYGGIAAKLIGLERVVSAVSGLGHTFSAKNLKTKFLRVALKPLFMLAFRAKKNRVIFQNSSDRDTLLGMGVITPVQVRMIKGSGVDLEQFKPEPHSRDLITVVFAARLLRSKGICEFIEAAEFLGTKYNNVQFCVAGDPDLENPQSITQSELEHWKKIDCISILGFRDDMHTVLSEADIVAFPSYYGEGLPKVLIEAAACGCPIVTTNHPGCRDAIIDGETGFLVAAKDTSALIEALEKLIHSAQLRDEFSKAARELAIREFDEKAVVDKHIEIYKEVLE